MRGEVSIFRGGAGGMPYFSSGCLNGCLRMGDSVCPEAMGIRSSGLRFMKKLRAKSVEDLIVWLKMKIEVVNHEATGDSPTWNPMIAARARFPSPERLACREIFSKCLVTRLKPEI